MNAKGTFSRKLEWQRTAVVRGSGVLLLLVAVDCVELATVEKGREGERYGCRLLADKDFGLHALGDDAAREDNVVE